MRLRPAAVLAPFSARRSPLIDVRHLSRTFRVREQDPGFAGAVRGLFRPRYREVRAITDVSFRVKAGEVVGLLGPRTVGTQ